MIRKDNQDVVYRTELGKFKAVIEEIVVRSEAAQPVLVGTISIEKSEFLSKMLSEPNRYVQFIEATAGRLLSQLVKADAKIIENANKLLSNAGALTPEKLTDLKPMLPKNALETFSYLESEVKTLQALRKGIKHQVLNAKQHQFEADIIAQAGRSGSITISTNMAGRGTDIQLGGNAEFAAYALLEKKGLSRYDDHIELFVAACLRDDDATINKLRSDLPKISDEDVKNIRDTREAFKQDFTKVKAAGGLHIIGTERHESRRIDNQLRGRSGRQGDPGSSRYYVSFEDDLMRLFANESVIKMLDRLGMDDTQPIEAQMVTSSIERAQKRVEDRNFGIRKQLLEFDNVMSKQREVVYAQRREVLLGNDEGVVDMTEGMIGDYTEGQADMHLSGDSDQWNLEQLRASLVDACPAFENFDFETLRGHKIDDAREQLVSFIADAYDTREKELGAPLLRSLERYVVLQVVDQFWKEHLHAMDVLRSGIFLRAYGQKDPFVEYKFEATKLFSELTETIKAEITKFIFRLQVNFEAPPQQQVSDDSSNDGEAQPQPMNNPFIKRSSQTTRIPKISRQDRRKLERDNKKK
jgi:preprotein translocase subunit SecA